MNGDRTALREAWSDERAAATSALRQGYPAQQCHHLERVVQRGKVITAAGAPSAIDMALTLLGQMYGPEVAQGIQLTIEYDPQPPFDAGSPTKAPAEIVQYVRSRLTIPVMTGV